MVNFKRECPECGSTAMVKINHPGHDNGTRVTEWRCTETGCEWNEARIRCDMDRHGCGKWFTYRRTPFANGRFPVQCDTCLGRRNAAYQRKYQRKREDLSPWIERWLAAANGIDGTCDVRSAREEGAAPFFFVTTKHRVELVQLGWGWWVARVRDPISGASTLSEPFRQGAVPAQSF